MLQLIRLMGLMAAGVHGVWRPAAAKSELMQPTVGWSDTPLPLERLIKNNKTRGSPLDKKQSRAQCQRAMDAIKFYKRAHRQHQQSADWQSNSTLRRCAFYFGFEPRATKKRDIMCNGRGITRGIWLGAGCWKKASILVKWCEGWQSSGINAIYPAVSGRLQSKRCRLSPAFIQIASGGMEWSISASSRSHLSSKITSLTASISHYYILIPNAIAACKR